MENGNTSNRLATASETEEVTNKCNHTQEVTGLSPVPAILKLKKPGMCEK